VPFVQSIVQCRPVPEEAVSLSAALGERGILPDVAAGHSRGEYAALRGCQ
jgi:hypothetical protein